MSDYVVSRDRRAPGTMKAGNGPYKPGSLSEKTVRTAEQALRGNGNGLRRIFPFLGPALIAAVAYVDPGNYATNIQAGATYGYRMLWVVVFANLMAMVIQTLSAKLGIATGRSLPELCRAYYPRPLNWALWGVAEVAAMATDVAEFLGASLALNLLFGLPLFAAAVLTGIITYLVLTLERFGFRPLEVFVGALLGAIALCYVLETIFSGPAWGQIVRHAVTPWLGDSGSVLLAAGIIGATVMPHAVYLHSGLTQSRIVPQSANEAVRIQRFERVDVVVAMSLAGLVNLAMMFTAATAFYGRVQGNIDIGQAFHTLTPILGPAAAGVFLASLLASGLSSSVVGTMAGQMIMQGFVGFTIPVWLRRLVTMLPTIILVALGTNPTRALVISQVVLSFALPAPLISLIGFTRRRDLMGHLVNPRWLTALVSGIAAVVIGLNVVLLYLTITGASMG
ncbi:Nramp family divalent metal transporter [Alicyclobacillus herbarius]|uniref:Nramp family divalent metal transporter n=1 Tax=Alicyclobacillus herbarius TaxID=122960 RepID=UPI0004053D03|nr:Nramp family divalent metal transporter [Alicyclobacillus herbarius]